MMVVAYFVDFSRIFPGDCRLYVARIVIESYPELTHRDILIFVAELMNPAGFFADSFFRRTLVVHVSKNAYRYGTLLAAPFFFNLFVELYCVVVCCLIVVVDTCIFPCRRKGGSRKAVESDEIFSISLI